MSEKTIRIKRMSRTLTSKECNELAQYYTDLRMKRRRGEREREILDLGIGGRVVYISPSSQFDVTGKCGTIQGITEKKRKGEPSRWRITVKFDNPVGERTYKRYDPGYHAWHNGLDRNSTDQGMQDLVRRIDESKYTGGFWEKSQKYYRHVIKKPVFTKHQEPMHGLIVNPSNLKPATPENIQQAQDTRRRQPFISQLNRALEKEMDR